MRNAYKNFSQKPAGKKPLATNEYFQRNPKEIGQNVCIGPICPGGRPAVQFDNKVMNHCMFKVGHFVIS
jgi:hypothetical protein